MVQGKHDCYWRSSNWLGLDAGDSFLHFNYLLSQNKQMKNNNMPEPYTFVSASGARAH